jgi:hypothetical protein
MTLLVAHLILHISRIRVKLKNVLEKFNREVLTKINIVVFKVKFKLEEKIA